MAYRGANPLPPAALSATRDRHALDQHRAAVDIATRLDIAANGDDLLEHVLHVAGNGHFLHGVLDFAVFHPEASRTPRVVAGHHVQPMAHQLGYQQATAHAPDQCGLVLDAVGDEQIVHAT
ncbi:hypothetical protein WR25_21960 [Diploscapter pachys]|uniref:Uncharacterized protein n=1 Tax=Diploscapter pachys TaxID=2018661 RepID=A0A2A2M5J4_9BILA|nr:hypothetical protein WR25_21960 [Diploscapter pachys]